MPLQDANPTPSFGGLGLRDAVQDYHRAVGDVGKTRALLTEGGTAACRAVIDRGWARGFFSILQESLKRMMSTKPDRVRAAQLYSGALATL